jgi:hypothetical protein
VNIREELQQWFSAADLKYFNVAVRNVDTGDGTVFILRCTSREPDRLAMEVVRESVAQQDETFTMTKNEAIQKLNEMLIERLPVVEVDTMPPFGFDHIRYTEYTITPRAILSDDHRVMSLLTTRQAGAISAAQCMRGTPASHLGNGCMLYIGQYMVDRHIGLIVDPTNGKYKPWVLDTIEHYGYRWVVTK